MALCLLCASATALVDSSGASYPRNITDSAGRTVTIQMPVERIIVLNSDAAEAVRILGAEDKIVGITDTIQRQSDYFPNLQDRQLVGTWSEFDYEAIGKLAKTGDSIIPDIIVICYPSGSYSGKSYGVDAVEAGLAPFKNITAVAFDFTKQSTMKDELNKLAIALGKEMEAGEFTTWNDQKVAAVQNAVKDLSKPKVYAERESKGGLGELSTYGQGSALNELIADAGGSNIVTENASYPKVSWEWIVTQDPDIILITPPTTSPELKGFGWDPALHNSSLKSIRDELMSRPGAETISAVKNSRVYLVYRDIFFGMDNTVGLTYLAKMLHPELTLDPESIYREYLDRIGLGYPVGKIFAYPEWEE